MTLMTTDYRAGWAARLDAFARFAAAVGIRAEGSPDEQIAALRAQQERLLARNDAAIAEADREGRALTPDEGRAIKRRAAQVEELEAQIGDLEVEGRTPQPRQCAAGGVEPLGAATPYTAGHTPRTPQPLAIGRRPTYAALFGGRRMTDPYGGAFASLGEFALAVADGHDPRLLRRPQAATMTEGTGSTGGFMVPTQYIGPILDAALEREVVRPRANVIPMTGKSATAGAFDYSSNANAARGGLRLLWGPEATALTEQRAAVREVSLSAHKANIFVRVSSELAADAVAFDQQLSTAMVNAVAAGLDYAFLQGTGAGQPLGVLNAGALVTVSKVGSQSSKLLLQNLADIAGALAPSSDARAIWVAHPSTRALLYGLAYVVQNVAGTENVGGAPASPITSDGAGNLRIYGREVAFTDALPVKFSKGDIMLCDFTRYAVGMRMDATIQRDQSVFFASDEIAFRLTLRCDGQPLDAAPVTLRDGSTSVGPFVCVEAH